MQSIRNVPFFNYPAVFARQEEKLMSTLREVMARGAYILQKDLENFERNLASYLGVKHAFGVADGSNALIIALMAAGIKEGDEVLVPSHTFIATAAAIHFAGGKPVLVDCASDHLIDIRSCQAKLNSKTRGIMPVQLNGRTANMDEVCAFAKEHGLILVEDSAQALGSKFKGKPAGTFGSAGTFSFYPAKLLGCYGDGGAIVTNSDQVARQVFMLRDHGRDPEGKVRRWGYNSRLDNIQAALLDLKLKDFETDLLRRRELAAIYQHELGGLRELLLPPGPDADRDHYDVYQNYEIEAENRDALKTHLEKNGVRTIIQWGGTPIHGFSDLGFTEPPPYTEQMFKRCLLLPMNTSLSNEDVAYVCEQIRTFYKG